MSLIHFNQAYKTWNSYQFKYKPRLPRFILKYDIKRSSERNSQITTCANLTDTGIEIGVNDIPPYMQKSHSFNQIAASSTKLVLFILYFE